MNTLLLLIVIALGLGGCQLSLPRGVATDPAAMVKAAPTPKAPTRRLDEQASLVEPLEGPIDVD